MESLGRGYRVERRRGTETEPTGSPAAARARREPGVQALEGRRENVKAGAA